MVNRLFGGRERKGRSMETEREKTGGRQIVLIVLFLLAIFIPCILGLFSQATGRNVDVPLKGYTEEIEDPKLTGKSWMDGSFQQKASSWTQEMIRPRGLMIKTYNTLNMMLFLKKNGMIVGKNYDLYETRYVEAELGLTAEDDFADPENDAKLTTYVESLERLQQKLKKVGKTLIYYVGPSKASAWPEDIPDRIKASDRYPLRAVDAIRAKLEKTEIPYLICADLKEELNYPDFYPTGIHWSRTYEQTASRKLIEMIREASGKNYRNIILGDVEESSDPFDRDNDLLDLANVFYRPKITYYQYRTKQEDLQEYDRMRIMIQGDSFSLGLRKDLIENDPEAEVFHVTRDESVGDRDDRFLVLYGDWGKMTWKEYLDRTDVIAIEAAEPLINAYSFGFVDELTKALDDYVPDKTGGDL